MRQVLARYGRLIARFVQFIKPFATQALSIMRLENRLLQFDQEITSTASKSGGKNFRDSTGSIDKRRRPGIFKVCFRFGARRSEPHIHGLAGAVSSPGKLPP